MTDSSSEEAPQPAYMIEGARSSRSKCKTCRKGIDKGAVRLGILVEGPFGTGYMWHHLKCAARNQFAKLEEAYAMEAWQYASEEPQGLPGLEELRKLKEEADTKKKERKVIPYAEHAPSGRAKCKASGETIPKGALRVALGQEVEFGGQVRISAYLVLPHMVAEALAQPDIVAGREIEPFELLDHLRENSKSLSDEDFAELEQQIGELR